MTGATISLIFVAWIGLGAQISALRGEIIQETRPTSVDGCPCMNETTFALEPTFESRDEAWFIYKVS